MQAAPPRPSVARAAGPVAPARRFGPGLLAAASNNDPTTVATLAVIGATTGYALCWLVVLIVPMLALVQSLAADVGAVCKTSLQGAVRQHYGAGWAVVLLCTFAAVNTLTLAADVKAGCEALALLTHLPAIAFVVPFVACVGWLLLSHRYAHVERSLSLLSIVFILYVGSALLAHIDGPALLHGIFVPQYNFSPAYAFGGIALLGTTLTGYVYMWESVGVAERHIGRAAIPAFERDAALGMVPIGVVFVFILIASAATLGRHHLPIETAADMAAALEPIAGAWAGVLFGLGLLASAILAVPVIAVVNAYVAAHTFGWPGSLDSDFRRARPFYAVVLGSLAIAAIVALAPVPAIGMLWWASIAGGLATPLSLAFLLLVAGNRRAMGELRMGRGVAILGWSVSALVSAAAVAFLASTFMHYGGLPG